jgi:glycosyltransferase involved in cell wall biosynthesis
MATHFFGLPQRFRDWREGRECFVYPAATALMSTATRDFDLIHVHNLHGDYFDLTALAPASRSRPVVITLHDEWLMTGHCAYTLGCERWRESCGQCPHLDVYPAIRRDATVQNLARKRETYRDLRAVVVAPSRWLLDRARVSALAPAMMDGRVIPNGVDLRTFAPADRASARRRMGWPQDAVIFLFSAYGGAANRFKDIGTVRSAVARYAQDRTPPSKSIILVFLGSTDPPVDREGYREIPVRILDDPAAVADVYRAADLYLHAARSENFPVSILEAMACGCPVIATAVGGIAEQFVGLELPMAVAGLADPTLPPAGVLTPAGDAQAMAQAMEAVLDTPATVHRLAAGARTTAERLYGRELQVGRYLDLYRDMLARAEKSS